MSFVSNVHSVPLLASMIPEFFWFKVDADHVPVNALHIMPISSKNSVGKICKFISRRKGKNSRGNILFEKSREKRRSNIKH